MPKRRTRTEEVAPLLNVLPQDWRPECGSKVSGAWSSSKVVTWRKATPPSGSPVRVHLVTCAHTHVHTETIPTQGRNYHWSLSQEEKAKLEVNVSAIYSYSSCIWDNPITKHWPRSDLPSPSQSPQIPGTDSCGTSREPSFCYCSSHALCILPQVSRKWTELWTRKINGLILVLMNTFCSVLVLKCDR